MADTYTYFSEGVTVLPHTLSKGKSTTGMRSAIGC